MKTVFYNGIIFTGEKFAGDGYVQVDGRKITAVGNGVFNPGNLSNNVTPTFVDLQSGYLVPAFIDIQLYGGHKQLFGEHPSVEALKATVKYSFEGGATHILPTVATNSPQIMHAAIEAVRDYWQQGLPGVIGLHLEGPYINPERRGAHIVEFIKQPTLQEAEALMQKGKGIIKMMTLAPEVCPPEVI
ncbi:MAG TPA: N-acetylglucosamine-6-phosphate deacetylase, partial [Chitinophagaceae bacterium]